ncbi:MAG: hypothetical protein AB7N76_20345 [Planctomycetota bacterium]
MSDAPEAGEVWDLLSRAYALDYGAEKLGLCEEAVRLADQRQDAELGFLARQALVEAATFGGFPDKALLAFTWCLAQCDKQPERFDETELLWSYKWVAARLPYFPQVTRARIEEVHADMARRYARSGLNLRPVAKIRWLAARRMGDRQEALAAYEESERLPRDAGADCAACERNDRVRYLLFTERLEDALAAAAPILSGRMSCAEIPHATLGMLLGPLLELGRGAEAARHHVRGYRLVRGNREFVGTLAEHLEFLVLTRNDAPAAALLEEHLSLALDTTDLDQRFRFFVAAAQLCRASGGERELALALSPRAGCHRPDGRYERAELGAWFEAEAAAIGERFDRRNGNAQFREALAEALARAGGERAPISLD